MIKLANQTVREILRVNYGMHAESLESVRRKSDRQVWKITVTGGGVYALKYVERSDRAAMAAAANGYFHRKGIPVATVIPALHGDSSVAFGQGRFLLFSWLNGTHPRYEEPGMIPKMAKLLAAFHETSHGYVASGLPFTDERLDWNRIYQRKIKSLAKFRERALASEDAYSEAFLRCLPWLQARAAWALDQLPRSALSALMDRSRQNPGLGHGDYSHLNLLRNHRNELTVIDLDTVSVALPMRDISHLTTCMNHEWGEWSGERFQLVVNAYRDVRPLSAEEMDLLLVDQIFPHKAIRLSKKYYRLSRNPSLLHELERCIEIDKAKLNDLGMGPR